MSLLSYLFIRAIDGAIGKIPMGFFYRRQYISITNWASVTLTEYSDVGDYINCLL